MSARRWIRRRGGRLLALCLAVCTLSGCGVGLQDLPIAGFRDTFGVTADLVTADGVVDGADVRSGQQVIGRVTGIALDGHTARLTMALDAGTDLPANVTAAVEIPSALGTPFIRLSAPEHPEGRLAAGAHIGVGSTSVGPQIESMLAALGNVVSGSGVGQLQSVMQSLNEAFASRSDKVGDLIDTLNRLLAKSSSFTGDFDAAMTAAAQVSELLAAQEDKITQFLEQTPRAVDVLAQQRDQIAGLLKQTGDLAANLDGVVDGTTTDLNRLVPDAAKLVDALAGFNSRVGQTLTSMNGFMANMSRAIRGDYLVFDGALDIPGGIDKILTGGLLLSGQPLPTPGELGDLLTGGLAGPRKKGER
ncbi:MCE family protein [Gordonia sp. PP30]|uniref:MCE family protein n=1 Tax=unclassified Gordonia (in: high G+C Gram-positive bacteria) TaxID=2657482 RepID=UPI001FFFE3DD|nr:MULTISPECIES: MCE family protein [unclassified Gordonia (in: high G+C Gram-positive bacteria)]UQE75931.1 MCE family protein [Gordonia sp. PP30]